MIERDEADRDRVRVLLDRWGVLFRSLLEREAPPLRWGRVFKTLRIMELSGEVVSGQFFEGVDGLQFAAPSALKRLLHPVDDDQVLWMSAADPASPCGLGLDGYPPAKTGRRQSYRAQGRKDCRFVGEQGEAAFDSATSR